jgi:hypothetical protein
MDGCIDTRSTYTTGTKQHLKLAGQAVSKQDAKCIDGCIDTSSVYSTGTKQH